MAAPMGDLLSLDPVNIPVVPPTSTIRSTPITTQSTMTVTTTTTSSLSAPLVTSLIDGPVPPDPDQWEAYCDVLANHYDNLHQRARMILLDALGVCSLGPYHVLRDRFVRSEVNRKFGPGTVPWDDEVDALRVPLTTMGFHATPEYDESLPVVRSDGLLRTGQSMGPYRDPIAYETLDESSRSHAVVGSPPPEPHRVTFQQPLARTEVIPPASLPRRSHPTRTFQASQPLDRPVPPMPPPSGNSTPSHPPDAQSTYNVETPFFGREYGVGSDNVVSI